MKKDDINQENDTENQKIKSTADAKTEKQNTEKQKLKNKKRKPENGKSKKPENILHALRPYYLYFYITYCSRSKGSPVKINYVDGFVGHFWLTDRFGLTDHFGLAGYFVKASTRLLASASSMPSVSTSCLMYQSATSLVAFLKPSVSMSSV